MSRDGGKGDKQRPLHVTEEQFNANWDTIFNRPVKTYTGGKPHLVERDPEEFFERARAIAKQLDWMSEKGYKDHPLTGNETTYEDRMNEPKLLANRIVTPDGTMLQSKHRHDYVTYIDDNGKEYMVDGGIDYQRTNVHDDAPHTNASVYDTDPHEIIRDAFHWGTRGKSGRDPIQYKPISSLSNIHIHNIIMTQTHVPDHVGNAFVNEELYRRDNGIVIEDTE